MSGIGEERHDAVMAALQMIHEQCARLEKATSDLAAEVDDLHALVARLEADRLPVDD